MEAKLVGWVSEMKTKKVKGRIPNQWGIADIQKLFPAHRNASSRVRAAWAGERPRQYFSQEQPLSLPFLAGEGYV